MANIRSKISCDHGGTQASTRTTDCSCWKRAATSRSRSWIWSTKMPTQSLRTTSNRCPLPPRTCQIWTGPTGGSAALGHVCQDPQQLNRSACRVVPRHTADPTTEPPSPSTRTFWQRLPEELNVPKQFFHMFCVCFFLFVFGILYNFCEAAEGNARKTRGARGSEIVMGVVIRLL